MGRCVMNKKLIRVLLLMLVFLIAGIPILSNISSASQPTTTAPATGDGEDSGSTDAAPSSAPVTVDNSANDTQRSMLKFFRSESSNLAVQQTSSEELKVYGVFLSNFLTPGKTTIKDLKSKELADSVSTKFFGSSGNSNTVGQINGVLYEGITSVMSSSKTTFALYGDSGGSNLLSGNELIAKFASKSGGSIYNSSKKEVLNTTSPATNATFKILFGYSPDFVLGKSGLRSIEGMYMDGFGNIWGSYKNGSNAVAVDEYVLVLPAAMNPAVFSSTTGAGAKFPVANVFAMGAVVGTKPELGQVENKADVMTPYYNMKELFLSGSGVYGRNINNFMSIVGVQSPNTTKGAGAFGNSDGLINDPSKAADVYPNIKNFLERTSGDAFKSSEGHVLVTPDIINLKASNSKDYFNDTYNKGLDNGQKIKLFNYFLGGTALTMEQLADDMYYFNINKGASGGEGAWNGSDTDSFVLKQKLFGKPATDQSSGGNYSFYSNSYFSSPFNTFLKGFLDAQDQDAYLKQYVNGAFGHNDNGTTAEFVALKNFLNTGYFSKDKSAISSKVATGALDLLTTKENKVYAYDTIPLATRSSRSDISGWWGIFKGDIAPASHALTSNDSILGYISVASKNSSIFNWYSKKTNGLFYYQGSSGGNYTGWLIGPNGGTLSTADQKAVANMFYNAMVYRVYSMNSTFTWALTSDPSGAIGADVKGPLGSYKIATTAVNGTNNYPGIYWGYMVALLGATVDSSGNWSTTGDASDLLPSMPLSTSGGSLDLNAVFDSSGVVSSDAKNLEDKQKDIIDKIYGLLSTEPNSYRDELIKATQDSWIIQQHRNITSSWVGDNTVSVSAGSGGSYASIVGYINTPSLYDLPLTSWVLKDYIYVYMVVMLLTLIGLVLMVLMNWRTIRAAIAIFALMAFVLLLPQFLITNVVNMSNMVGDQIFSGKFNYWALTQHQQSLKSVESAKSTGDEMNYIIAQNMESAKNVYSKDVGVRIKWMAPKRDDVFDSLFNSDGSLQNLKSDLTMFRWLFSNFFNQQEYVYNDPMATYLYRPYNAIAADAKNGYAAVAGTQVNKQSILQDLRNNETSVLSMPAYRFKAATGDVSMDDPPILYSDQQKQEIKEAGVYSITLSDNANDYRFWALGNEQVTNAMFRSDYTSDAGLSGDIDDPYYKQYTLSTESPFYYFYNVFKNRYAGVNGSFKSALLSDNVFKVKSDNLKVNNKMRDFMDMEGLFTYVVPYLKQGNDYVYGWRQANGSSIEGYNFADNKAPDDVNLNQQYKDQEKHKQDVRNVWKMYAPWVDQIYKLGVYNDKITVANKKAFVDDAINPGAYRKQGRDMIFSPADMAAKSYEYSDLSPVERRIQATLDSTYTDLMYLTNYYDFDDETLITAAAMMATFNFDREFSQKNLFGENVTLYPQSYELKNFNYDAFMRLLLLNSTGEPLMSDQDLYVRVIDKTSLVTGIALIACDIFGVFIIPTAKIAVLVLLLFLTLLVALSAVLSPPNKLIKTIFNLVGIPSLLFLGSTIAFAWVISMFMGEGLTGYVGSRSPELGITDPTIMMCLMILVDCVYLFILWRIMLTLLRGLKTHIITVGSISQALTAGALVAVAGTALGAVKGRLSNAFGGGGYGGGSRISEERQAARNRQRAQTDADREQRDQDRVSRRIGVYGTPSINKEDKQDDAMLDRINRLASGSQPASSFEDRQGQLISRKTLGNRVVDYRYGARMQMRDAVDKTVSAGQAVSNKATAAANYAVSKEGLRADVRKVGGKTVTYVRSSEGLRKDVANSPAWVADKSRDIGRHTKDTVLNSSVTKNANAKLNSARSTVNNYVSDVRRNEQRHLEQEIQRQKNNPSPLAQRRLEQDRVRLVKLEDKRLANDRRQAARSAVKTSGNTDI